MPLHARVQTQQTCSPLDPAVFLQTLSGPPSPSHFRDRWIIARPPTFRATTWLHISTPLTHSIKAKSPASRALPTSLRCAGTLFPILQSKIGQIRRRRARPSRRRPLEADRPPALATPRKRHSASYSLEGGLCVGQGPGLGPGLTVAVWKQAQLLGKRLAVFHWQMQDVYNLRFVRYNRKRVLVRLISNSWEALYALSCRPVSLLGRVGLATPRRRARLRRVAGVARRQAFRGFRLVVVVKSAVARTHTHTHTLARAVYSTHRATGGQGCKGYVCT